ncbi:MAG TPA: LamG-like jellyroll fold domain-containing protein [Anaerolineales bacterium]|nr:LamG-like jellyroll fold domain-containing protein [Anaerolineales bacterium]
MTETRVIGTEQSNEQHSVTTHSDWLGRALTTTYDDGEVVSYTYDDLGRPDQMKSSASGATLVDLAYNVLGQIESQTLGNGTQVTNTYDAQTTRLTERKAETGSTTLLDLAYDYDANGNITRLEDRQLNETQFYTYDFLNRLTSAVGASGTPTTAPTDPETYGQQFEYDKVGNIEQLNNWGTAPTLPTQQQQGRAPSDDDFVLAYSAPEDKSLPVPVHAPVYQEEPTATPSPTYTATVTPTATPRIDDNYTVVLLHMNGTDESTVFADESGKEWTAAGNAQIDIAESKFGGASGLFDGSGDSISTPDHDNFHLSDHDWTFDFWVRFNTLSSDTNLITQYEDADNWMKVWVDTDPSRLYFAQTSGGEVTAQFYANAAFALNTWYHIVVERKGNSPKIAVNGTFRAVTEDVTIANKTFDNLDGALTLGMYEGLDLLDGQIDEFRFSNGIARWITNFTPPVSAYSYQIPVPTNIPPGTSTPSPTSTYTFTPTPIANNAKVVSLLHMDGGDGSETFTDETGRAWTAHGNAQIDTAESKFGGASAYFDGSGDYLAASDSNDFYFNGDFTVDFWARFNSVSGNRYFFSQKDTDPPGHWVYFFYDGTSTIKLQAYNGSEAGVSGAWGWTPSTGTWYHIALVKSGNTYKVFVDGNQIGSPVTDTDPWPNVASPMYVGILDASGYCFKGWLDDMRFTKGVARWTSNFTPPDSPHPYATLTPTVTATYTPTATPVVVTGVDGSYTVSLLHMNGADGSTIFPDETGNIWTAAGDAQIDTEQSVFGGGSALLDGNGDSVSSPDSNEFYLNGNFTIDLRARFNALPTTGHTEIFFAQWVDSDNCQYVGVQNNSGTYQLVIRARSGGTDSVLVLKDTTLSLNTWYHLAFVRQGNNYMIFKNGNQVGTTVTDADAIPNYAAPAQIGARGSGSEFNGWIDEFRVSKDVARWTSNFTPPDSEYIHETDPSAVLMAYWDFEVVTDTTVRDVAPSDLASNNATLQNGATIVADGADRNAVSFDGTDDSVTVADHAEIRKNGSSFTLSAWINPSALVTNHTQYIINKGVSATNFDYGFITTSRSDVATATATPAVPNVDTDGKLVFRVGDLTPNKVIGPILPVNTWTLVTGVYDSIKDELRLYINGRLVAVEKVTGTVSMGTGALSFSPAGNLYQGKLDEVRFYSRALTDDEVTQLLGTFITPTPIPPSPTTAVTPATPTLVPTPLPESAKKWGTGADGNLTIAATATAFNLNAHTSNGRTCADGVAYSVTRLGSTIATLNATPAAGCLNPGDEIMLINLKSAGRNDHNAGAYEFLRVASVNGNSVLFTSMKTRWYGNAWHSDANIGTGSGQQRVMLMRVPNYNNVTLEGTLTSSGYDGYKYGVVVFHVAGTFTGAGTVSANARGYPGAVLGESLADGYSAGHNALYNLASGTGVGSNGGGGGHATVGKIGGSDESAGSGGSLTYGSPQISQLFMGSGGGAANLHWYHNSSGNWAANPGPNGGDGGGIVLIAGQTINFTGAVQAIGATKPSNDTPLRGGAGAGGSIRIEGNTVTLGSLNARGGSSADAYGFGGKGRIGVYYENSVSISTSNPSAYTGVFGQGPAPTPSPTPISFATPNPYGTGADGDLTVETGSTFNLNTDISETRSCADGVAYNVTGLTVTSAKLTTSPITGCLSIGDEVMLVHLRGSGPNTGNFEFLRVGGITGNTVYFKTQKVHFYGASADSDASIGLGTDEQRVMLLRVPNYETVTVDGTLTGNTYDYNNYLYGVVAFRVHGALTGAGTIHASKKGFPGEIWGSALDKGYSPGKNATYNDYARDNANGGGGGHATAGKDGGTKDTDGAGGKVIYGNPQLSLLFMGSGGGRANLAWPAGDPGPNGGNGGGIVFVAGETINFTGSINAIGATKPSNDTSLRGGAGAGGSIRLEGNTITLGSLSAGGGSPSDTYGAGGAGRIAIYYSGSLSNEATLCAGASTYCKNTSETSTPTSTPTPVTGTNPGTSALVSWWTLDETSGTRQDSHSANHLTDVNTVGYATGMKGNAASFVPANQERLTIPDNADISTGNIDFTLIAHVYLNNAANAYNLVDKSGTAATYDYRLAYNPATGFRFRVGTAVYVDSGPVSANTWYTVIAWHDAGNDTINIQVNDGTANTVSYSGGAADTDYALVLGAATDGTYMLDGRLDEVALYKRVLTAAERTWLYDGGSTRTYAEVSASAAQDWYASNYTYSTAIPHAVTEVDRGSFADSFTYDENGNMTCRVESGVTYKQEYNAENRISSIWKLASGTCAEPGPLTDKWDFTYDGDGVRTGQLYTPYTEGEPGAAVTTRYYFGGAYETTNGTWKKYYSFGGMTLMRDATGFKYFLSDHLGSVAVVLSPDGDDPDTEIDVEQQRYLPFGEVRTDIATPPYRITSTDFTYTGQRNVTGTGLMDYKARFYSTYITQFTQPDSIVPNLSNPQSLNHYAYALNNPIRYTDPTGHKACGDGEEWECSAGRQQDPSIDPHPNWLLERQPYAERYNRKAKKNQDAKDPDDLKTSYKAKEQIKVWEGGFYDTPYNDGPDGKSGNCTIGYGTVLSFDVCSGDIKKQYNPKFGGKPLDQTVGEGWFEDDIAAAEQVVRDTVHVKLTQSQFDALVSYVYNSGGEPGHWYIDKKIPEKLNSGHYYEAAMVIDSGPTGGNNVGHAPGLVPRRHQEAEMFLYGLYP